MNCKHTNLTYLKSTVFWAVMPCSLVEAYCSFGGIYCLIIRVKEKVHQTCSKHSNYQYMQLTLFLAWFTLQP
jgi:hypothetical protein